MAETTDRPQDVGRRHRGKGRPSPETAARLARWNETLRAELDDVIERLAPKVPPPGLLDDVEGAPAAEPQRPALRDRAALLDIGIKVARELGAEIDPGPAPDAAPAKPARGRSRKVDYGP